MSTGSVDRSLSNFTEEELAMREAVSRLAREQIEPRVREMEEKGDVPAEIRELMFKNGVCIISYNIKAARTL
jgi:hypothetical protein